MFEIGEIVDFEGRLAKIEECDGLHYKVRIQSGYEGAGQVMQVHPDHLVELKPEPLESHEEESKFEKVKKWGVYMILAGILIALSLVVLSPQNTKMTQKVEQLHQINIDDSADIEIIREAKERIKSRSMDKSKLIEEIGFGKF